jgi:excisionase family DNA binding protein
MLLMQQILSSREAASLLDVNGTTIQRAIQRNELAATRRKAHGMFQIQRADLIEWAAKNGYAVRNGNGDRVDAQTGEVLEADASPAELAIEARARLEGLREPIAEAEAEAEPAAPISNVASVILADRVANDRLALLSKLVTAGQFEAAQLVVEAWA